MGEKLLQLQPPYYAVIFTSRRTTGDAGYADMAEQMEKLAGKQPGFLGIESARDADGLGITVSYWVSEQAIADWKANAAHQVAQRLGKTKWYESFVTRVCKVERESPFFQMQDDTNRYDA